MHIVAKPDWYTKSMVRKFEIKDTETEKQCLNEIIAHVQDLETTDIGVIAAQDLLDIVKQKLAPVIYNQAIDDVKRLVSEKLEDLETDVEMLKQ